MILKKRINSKKKGNLWENKLANWLFDHGIKAYKEGHSGGGDREKGDIVNNLDMTIESKAAKKIDLPDWWRQVDRAASIHGNSPVLFIHQDGMRDNEWLVVMHSEDWIDLIKKQHEKTKPDLFTCPKCKSTLTIVRPSGMVCINCKLKKK